MEIVIETSEKKKEGRGIREGKGGGKFNSSSSFTFSKTCRGPFQWHSVARKREKKKKKRCRRASAQLLLWGQSIRETEKLSVVEFLRSLKRGLLSADTRAPLVHRHLLTFGNQKELFRILPPGFSG